MSSGNEFQMTDAATGVVLCVFRVGEFIGHKAEVIQQRQTTFSARKQMRR